MRSASTIRWLPISALALVAILLLTAACKPKYALNVSIDPPNLSGAEVDFSPEPDSEGRFKEGTEVRVLAAPFEILACGDSSYWSFFGWKGDASGSFPTAIVKMDGERNLTAEFAEYFPESCDEPPTVAVNLEDPDGSGVYEFDPAELTFSVGETVTFELSAESELHTFTVDELGIDQAVDAGKTVTFTFTFEEAGEYKLICIPHEANGMVGTITVE